MNEPTPTTPARPRPGFGRSVGPVLLGIGLVALVLWWIAPSWDEVADQVEVDPLWLGLSVIGSLGTTVFTAARWKLLSETMGGSRLPYGVYFHSLALVRLLSQVLPAAVVDLVGRGVALKAAGSRNRMGELLTPIVLERLLDLLLPLAMLAWALVVVLPTAADPTVAPLVDPWISLAVLLTAFGLLAVPSLGPMARVAVRAYGWLRRLRRRDRALAPPSPPSVAAPLAGRVVVLGMLRYASMLGQFWAAGAGLGVSLAPLSLVAATPVAQLAVIIGITPGGLGLAEGGWAAALSQLGYGEAAVVVFMAATRVMMGVSFAILTAASWPWRGERTREDSGPA